MLLSFTVKNFRSFRETQTLSMVASMRQPDHPDHLADIPDDENKVLPVVVIYGANGAGKSNLVKSLALLENLILRGTEPKKTIGRRPFLLDAESAGQATELTAQFVEKERVYAFGCRFSDIHIEAEWLSLLRSGKEISVYERKTNDAGEVTVVAGLALKSDSAKAAALAEVGVLPNQLFLHAVGKSLREQDQGPILAGALGWFTERLTIIPASASFSLLAQLVAQDNSFTEFAGDFLRNVATGVDRLRVDTTQVEEGMLASFGSEINHIIKELPVGEKGCITSHDGSELIIEKGAGTKAQLRTIKAEHVTEDGGRVTLPFSDQSDGTQRLTHLLPTLHAIREKPGLFVIDEIDRSLHPLLAKGFVKAFLKACAGTGSQLIFTTHETAFLDLDLLRRDEIWFANKKLPAGPTELYSLSDYKIRTDLKIDKAYLQGRFEAVPPVEPELPEWVLHIMSELKPGTVVKPLLTK